MEFQDSVRNGIHKCVSNHLVIQFGFDFDKVEFSVDVIGHDPDMRVIGFMSCVVMVFTDLHYV